jgi:Alginate export
MVAAVLCLAAAPLAARADDSNSAPERPTILFNRWQEDWSVLADPRVPRQPFDEFKYIPLSDIDPYTYVSFGADTRERFESNNAQGFGTGPNRNQDYVISRNELNADPRIASQVQMFVQFQSDFAPWKTMLSRVDVDRLDLEQAFVALTEPVGDGTLKLRVGRQQFAFDLQRFVFVRDGPNVRQSYDAGWTRRCTSRSQHWRRRSPSRSPRTRYEPSRERPVALESPGSVCHQEWSCFPMGELSSETPGLRVRVAASDGPVA